MGALIGSSGEWPAYPRHAVQNVHILGVVHVRWPTSPAATTESLPISRLDDNGDGPDSQESQTDHRVVVVRRIDAAGRRQIEEPTAQRSINAERSGFFRCANSWGKSGACRENVRGSIPADMSTLAAIVAPHDAKCVSTACDVHYRTEI